jgi:hypothetical protein
MNRPKLYYIGPGIRNVYDIEHGRLSLHRLNQFLQDHQTPPVDEMVGSVESYYVRSDREFQEMVEYLEKHGAYSGMVGGVLVCVLEHDSHYDVLISDPDIGTQSFFSYHL